MRAVTHAAHAAGYDERHVIDRTMRPLNQRPNFRNRPTTTLLICLHFVGGLADPLIECQGLN